MAWMPFQNNFKLKLLLMTNGVHWTISALKLVTEIGQRQQICASHCSSLKSADSKKLRLNFHS